MLWPCIPFIKRHQLLLAVLASGSSMLLQTVSQYRPLCEVAILISSEFTQQRAFHNFAAMNALLFTLNNVTAFQRASRRSVIKKESSGVAFLQAALSLPFFFLAANCRLLLVSRVWVAHTRHRLVSLLCRAGLPIQALLLPPIPSHRCNKILTPHDPCLRRNRPTWTSVHLYVHNFHSFVIISTTSSLQVFRIHRGFFVSLVSSDINQRLSANAW